MRIILTAQTPYADQVIAFAKNEYRKAVKSGCTQKNTAYEVYGDTFAILIDTHQKGEDKGHIIIVPVVASTVNIAFYGEFALSGQSSVVTSAYLGTDVIGGFSLSGTSLIQTSAYFGEDVSGGFMLSGTSLSKPRLTITANNKTIPYEDISLTGGAGFTGGNGVTCVGFVGTDTIASLTGTLEFSGTSQGAWDIGTYSIDPGGLTSDYYLIEFVSGVLTVGKAQLVLAVYPDARTLTVGYLEASILQLGLIIVGFEPYTSGQQAQALMAGISGTTTDATIVSFEIVEQEDIFGQPINVPQGTVSAGTIGSAVLTLSHPGTSKYEAAASVEIAVTVVAGVSAIQWSNLTKHYIFPGETCSFIIIKGTSDGEITVGYEYGDASIATISAIAWDGTLGTVTITGVAARGVCSFVIQQAAYGSYAATSFNMSESLTVCYLVEVVSSGGAEAGGTSLIGSVFNRSIISTGGAEASGTSSVDCNRNIQVGSTGGAVASGSSSVDRTKVQSKPRIQIPGNTPRPRNSFVNALANGGNGAGQLIAATSDEGIVSLNAVVQPWSGVVNGFYSTVGAVVELVYEGFGAAQITVMRQGDGVYLDSEWSDPVECQVLGVTNIFASSGGAVASGLSIVDLGKHRLVTSSGGAVASGHSSCITNRNQSVSSSGGAVASGSSTVTVDTRITPVITVNDTSITYQSLPSSYMTATAKTLSGATIPGTFTWSPDYYKQTLSVAGSPYAIEVTFTPTDQVTYRPAWEGAWLTVTPKLMTIVAHNKSKQYGTPDPAFTYTMNGLPGPLPGATGALSRTPGEVTGQSYPINLGTLSGGSNYDLVFPGPGFSGSGSLSISKATQTLGTIAITYTAGTGNPAIGGRQLLVGDTGIISISSQGASGLPVVYTSSAPAVASVSGTAVTILAVGTFTITANQATDYVNYLAATPVTSAVNTVGKKPVTITLASYVATYNKLAVLATAIVTPSQPATITYMTAARVATTMKNAGAYIVRVVVNTATHYGTAEFQFTVQKANVTFIETDGTTTYGIALTQAKLLTLVTPSTSGTFGFYLDDGVTPAVGQVLEIESYFIRYKFVPTDTANYNSELSGTLWVGLEVTKGIQTIGALTVTGSIVTNVNGGTGSVTPTTSSAGLPVTFTASSGLSVIGNLLSCLVPGTYYLYANQAGDVHYLPAAQVVKAVVVQAPIPKTNYSLSYTLVPPSPLYRNMQSLLTISSNVPNGTLSVSSSITSVFTVRIDSPTQCTITGVAAGNGFINLSHPGDSTHNPLNISIPMQVLPSWPMFAELSHCDIQSSLGFGVYGATQSGVIRVVSGPYAVTWGYDFSHNIPQSEPNLHSYADLLVILNMTASQANAAFFIGHITATQEYLDAFIHIVAIEYQFGTAPDWI